MLLRNLSKEILGAQIAQVGTEYRSDRGNACERARRIQESREYLLEIVLMFERMSLLATYLRNDNDKIVYLNLSGNGY